MAQLTTVRGDTFTYTATITDETGAASDLTDCTVWVTIKAQPGDTDDNAIARAYWVSGGASSGITVSTPASGQFTVSFAASATTNWVADGQYFYDVQLKNLANAIRTVDRGTVLVQGDITRRTTTP